MAKKIYNPANPSPKAAARVKDPHALSNICPHCGGVVTAEHNSRKYGRAFGQYPWIYMCNSCYASVGMHPNTNIALGTLANDEIRAARKACKPPFIRYCNRSKLSRGECYAKLSRAMKLSVKECHFGLFNVEQCSEAKQIVEGWIKDLNKKRPS